MSDLEFLDYLERCCTEDLIEAKFFMFSLSDRRRLYDLETHFKTRKTAISNWSERHAHGLATENQDRIRLLRIAIAAKVAKTLSK